MPGIFDFIKSLTTRIEKNTLLDDVDTSIREINNFTIPALQTLSEVEKITPFTNEFAKKAENGLYAAIKFSRKGNNWISDLQSQMANVGQNLQSLRKIAEDALEQDTLKDAVTARGAHVIRAASAMSFLSRYAFEMSDFIMALEVSKVGKQDSDVPPAQVEYMNKKLDEFYRILADYSIPNKDFMKIFGDLPSIYLDQEGTSSGMFSRIALDPFKNSMSMSGFRGNPIYHLRLLWTEWEAKRYHAAKERQVILNLRLIHLRNLQADQPNIRIEREIEGVQKRLDNLDRWIRDVEQSVE